MQNSIQIQKVVELKNNLSNLLPMATAHMRKPVRLLLERIENYLTGGDGPKISPVTFLCLGEMWLQRLQVHIAVRRSKGQIQGRLEW